MQDANTTLGTADMETGIIDRIKSDVAELAKLDTLSLPFQSEECARMEQANNLFLSSVLGMSWISGNTEFQAEITPPTNEKETRTHILKNMAKISTGYKVSRSCNTSQRCASNFGS